MDDEWRYVVLSVGTFIFLFVLLLACVRSCARLSEEAVLGRMEAAERAQYLAAAAATSSVGRPQLGRHIQWIVRPWNMAAAPVNHMDSRRDHAGSGSGGGSSVYIISGSGNGPTSAAYDVATTRSVSASAAFYESQLPSYEEATSGLPSYDLLSECRKDKNTDVLKSNTDNEDTTKPPAYSTPPKHPPSSSGS